MLLRTVAVDPLTVTDNAPRFVMLLEVSCAQGCTEVEIFEFEIVAVPLTRVPVKTVTVATPVIVPAPALTDIPLLKVVGPLKTFESEAPF